MTCQCEEHAVEVGDFGYNADDGQAEFADQLQNVGEIGAFKSRFDLHAVLMHGHAVDRRISGNLLDERLFIEICRESGFQGKGVEFRDHGHKLCTGALSDHLTVIDNGDAVADLLDLVHIVGGVNDRCTPFTEYLNGMQDMVTGLCIHADGRLIHNDELGVVGNTAGNIQPAFHTAGHLFRLHFELFGKSHKCKSLPCRPVQLRTLQPVEGSEEFHVLQCIQMGVHSDLLRHNADELFDLRCMALNVHASDLDRPLCIGIEGRDDVDGGGLAGTVGTDQTENFALADMEGEVIHGTDIAVMLYKILDTDIVFHRNAAFLLWCVSHCHYYSIPWGILEVTFAENGHDICHGGGESISASESCGLSILFFGESCMKSGQYVHTPVETSERSLDMAYHKVVISGINTSELKVLREEEKMALLREFKETGSKAARDELIQGNLRLVLSVIQRFAGRGEDVDDLFQIGVVGLIKAINNFDLTKEVRFSTYCVPMISGELRRYLRDYTQIKVSRSLRDLAYRAIQAKEQLTNELQREPSMDEIAEELGEKRADVVIALESISDPVSLYEPVYSDAGDTLYVMDQLSDKSSAESWLSQFAMRDAMRSLEDREKNILYLRFLCGKTQVEVAKEIGISQAQVSRLEKGAIAKIKEAI